MNFLADTLSLSAPFLLSRLGFFSFIKLCLAKWGKHVEDPWSDVCLSSCQWTWSSIVPWLFTQPEQKEALWQVLGHEKTDLFGVHRPPLPSRLKTSHLYFSEQIAEWPLQELFLLCLGTNASKVNDKMPPISSQLPQKRRVQALELWCSQGQRAHVFRKLF